jgi:pimeloyl-ACP methyl ester carboxylesterase
MSERPTRNRIEYQTGTNGKVLRAGGADDPQHRVLCLPGGLCTAPFYDDLLAVPALAASGVRAIATTLPGFGGVPFPAGFDATPEAHAAFAGELARDLGCDAVVGHSFGANVALEMAAGGHFSGHLILVAPTFSAEDEMKGLATFNRIGYVPGLRSLVTALMFRSFPKMLKGGSPRTASIASPPRWRATTAWTSAPTCAAGTSTCTGTARSPVDCVARAFRRRSSSARTTRSA